VLAKENFDHMQAHFVDSPFEKRSVSSTVQVSAAYGWRIVACSTAQFSRAPKIVIASGHLPFDVVPAVILGRRYRAKFVVYVFHLLQMQVRHPSPRNTIARLAEDLALYLIKRYADLVVTDNTVVREQLIQFGVAAERIRVSPLGIPVDMIRSAPPSPEQYQAVFFGRLVEHKGIYDLIDTWERVVAALPGSKLLVVGDGPDRAALTLRIREKRLDGNVELAGFLNPPQSYAALKKCRLCLFPSHEEGWGIAICEAMACGLPVVAFDLPAYRSVFHAGIVTAPFGDCDGLARHVLRLLADEALCAELGKAAVRQAEEYDVTAIARTQWTWLCDLVQN
jgi:glycosyltransferase involved in cell wall biosynthesis